MKKTQDLIDYEKMSPLDKEKISKLKEADILKHKANDEQKKHNFAEAITLFNEALKMTPADNMINLNLASTYLEMKDYENCLKECEIVLKNCDDSSKRARACGKIGIANMEMNNYAKAIEFFKLSLSEHKDERISDLLIEAESLKSTFDSEKYFDTEKGELNNKRAYDLYRLGKFEEALNEYSEAVRRNPKNPRYYCNRAEAFIKVLDFEDAIKDCERAIELDKNFLRAYLRKATAHMMLKQFPQALEIYELGLDIEKGNSELIEGRVLCYEAMSSELKNLETWAKSAPAEIKNIILDPQMKRLLEDFKDSPAMAHEIMMKDKQLSRAFHLLVEYGMSHQITN